MRGIFKNFKSVIIRDVDSDSCSSDSGNVDHDDDNYESWCNQMMNELHPLRNKPISDVFPILHYFEHKKMTGEEMRQ